MAVALIWKPVGVEPTNDEFRVMRVPGDTKPAPVIYPSVEAAVEAIGDLEWDDQRPWLLDDGNKLLTPDDIKATATS